MNVFKRNHGNVPIQFFGKPFYIISNVKTRHCLQGPTKVIRSKRFTLTRLRILKGSGGSWRGVFRIYKDIKKVKFVNL